ncbi:hypothetical protein BU23DRAFT_634109 [Bimuria novae-zelandiae CBS 107.79]|uniref:Uncharacterized protein n=1 Tax=Bimuria novae-zelandiae CBS 107.79 TaxID=1447943 RepID=A0A6A5VD92_9PLEO|nr:hypothetical protein BU23DRAFT_634109 [Bimuria novae-zelandiae CBS 107.79]
MAVGKRIAALHQKIRLQGDAAKLKLSTGKSRSANTVAAMGLSVRQAMLIIVVGRILIASFSTLIAWAGVKWHIGFTVQNRYSWDLRVSYIPLLQRILLNFIWNANGGGLCAVCITAIWPSFARIKNKFGPDMPTTSYEFIGFVVFWFLSTLFLWLRPEKFKIPFIIVCAWCSAGMLAWMIWALAVAKGVGPLWNIGQQLPAASPWNSSWLIMAGINQSLGGLAAGITNGSDFSRYASARKHYLIETITTARARVFFCSAGFAFTAMFENIYSNTIAGGIDLAGRFPCYINIRRDYFVLHKCRVKLSHLYRNEDSSYYFWKGINWRAIPAWICGWAPTIGGLIVTVRMDPSPPRSLVQLYNMAFLIGFYISATVSYLLNLAFPIGDMD